MTDTVSIYKDAGGKARCMALYEAALSEWPVPYQELDADTSLGKTHVIASGEAGTPPLVLLHGQWATATMWCSLIRGLSRDQHAYAIDQIDDVGKSQPSRIPSGRPEYAQWLVEVLDKLKIEQGDVVGLSYGGFLALNLALYAPDRVKRLVLLCPGMPSLGPPTLAWAIHGLPITILPIQATAEWLVQGMSVNGYRADNREMQLLVAGALSVRSRIPFRPVFADDELRNLKSRVLLLIGEKETMYEPHYALDRARGLIPHIEAEIISGAGHMLSTDQPGLVESHLHKFLHQRI